MICNLFGSVVGRGLYRRCRALSLLSVLCDIVVNFETRSMTVNLKDENDVLLGQANIPRY